MPNKRALCLMRTVPKFRDLKLFAFDIEYRRDTGELIEACIGDEQTQYFARTWEDTLAILFKLGRKSKQTRFIVHAGDIAEFCHLVEYIMHYRRDDIEIYPTTSGDNIVGLELRYEDVKVKIYDLFALFPMRLEKIAAVFAPDYPKLAGAVDFDQRDYNPETDQEYLRRDVQATVNSYRNISILIYEHFNVQPSMTAAGTAMRGWLAHLPEDTKHYRLNETEEDFCRSGYFGAYVHPGYDNLVHFDVVSYDITAAYGARMRYQFPVGKPTVTYDYQTSGLGMWEVEVTCIDAELPIVPYRAKNGVCWLGTPGETVKTVAITQEIEYYKTHGYSVVVNWGLHWKTTDTIFKDFIDKVEKVESISPVTKQIAKPMRNALYGRFGTKKYHERFVLTTNPAKGLMPYTDPVSGKFLENVYTQEEELDVAYIQPHWAAHITAYQRLAMFDLIFQCGVKNMFGVDTDSIKTYASIVKDKALPISETEYGKGKIEAHWVAYRSHGPKNYVGLEANEKYSIKSKGIPKKAITAAMMKQHMERDQNTEAITVKFSSITKALTMMKRNGKASFHVPSKRTLAALHSEKWEITDQGLFKPLVHAV